MALRACLHLASRYLRPRLSFVSLITLLSILGPILGVATLIVVIAVMTGFGLQLREKIFGMQAHLQLRPYSGTWMADPGPARQSVQALGLRSVAVVEGPVLLQHQRQIVAKFLRGVGLADRQSLADSYPGLTIRGQGTLRKNEAIIGANLAQELDLGPGSKLIVHATGRLRNMIHFKDNDEVEIVQPKEAYTPEELTVVGIFESGMYDYDANFVFTHLEMADEIFDMPWGAAGSINVWAPDPFRLAPLVAQLRNDPACAGLAILTWRQLNSQIFDALAVEKAMQFFLLTIIVVVAGFSIAGTLITVVVQKTREIGVLKAMGASPLTVLGIFAIQGAIVGALGVSLGTGLGLWLVEQRDRLHLLLAAITGYQVFPPELYHFTSIPARIEASDILLITGSAFTICILAALLPACYAAMLQPSRALRNDAG